MSYETEDSCGYGNDVVEMDKEESEWKKEKEERQ